MYSVQCTLKVNKGLVDAREMPLEVVLNDTQKGSLSFHYVS